MDKAHEQYYKENPNGNHDKMSLETKMMFDKLNATLELQFQRQEEKMNEIKDDTTKIHTQTKETNGRVTKLESWKNRLIGAWIVTELVLLPLAVWALIQVLERNV